MKKFIAGSAMVAAGIVGAAGVAAAGNGPNSNACTGLTKAHNTLIEKQGLDFHLTLEVHQQFSTKLLPSACG